MAWFTYSVVVPMRLRTVTNMSKPSKPPPGATPSTYSQPLAGTDSSASLPTGSCRGDTGEPACAAVMEKSAMPSSPLLPTTPMAMPQLGLPKPMEPLQELDSCAKGMRRMRELPLTWEEEFQVLLPGTGRPAGAKPGEGAARSVSSGRGVASSG